MAAKCITLLACLIPMVFILRKPINWVNVPKTGSTAMFHYYFEFSNGKFLYLSCSRLRNNPADDSATKNIVKPVLQIRYNEKNHLLILPISYTI